MSALRTQVYLTAAQRERIDDLAGAEGVTMAEIVRRALDALLSDRTLATLKRSWRARTALPRT